MSADIRRATFYLAIRPKNYSGLAARVTSNQPKLAEDERVLEICVTVPGALFTRPTLRANVTVPVDAVQIPQLDAGVSEIIREVLEQKTGLSVEMKLIHGEQKAAPEREAQ